MLFFHLSIFENNLNLKFHNRNKIHAKWQSWYNRFLQRNQTNRGHTHTNGKTHIYLEAKKSHHLPLKLETQKNQKGNSECKGLKIRGADGWSSSLGSEMLRIDVPDQWVRKSLINEWGRKKTNREKSFPPVCFVLFTLSMDWMMLAHIREGSVLWVSPIKC